MDSSNFFGSSGKKASKLQRKVFPIADNDEAKNAVNGFVTGDDGVTKLAPWPRPQSQASASKSAESSNGVKRIPKKYIPIEPINLKEIHETLTSSTVQKKPIVEAARTTNRKTKVPMKHSPRKRLSFGTKTTRPSMASKKRVKTDAMSPLWDVDKAEAILRGKPRARTPRITVAHHVTPPKQPVLGTPASSNSDGEFLEMEQTCATPMQTTKIENRPNSKIARAKILFQEMGQLMVKLQSKYQELGEIICEMEDKEEIKENLNPNFAKPSTNNNDLRKFALKKCLPSNNRLENASPKTKKAVDLYNVMRRDCSVLCTPKMDRTLTDLPQASASKSLSRRIQNQCLLLQDTPR